MSDVVVRVEGVGKRYRIGGKQQGYKTFREAIVRTVRAPMDRFKARHDSTNNTFWALKDVSFEVKRGEVLGIIGRNGAGKSTLLKILSRITEPTEGTVYLKGRVGSLLEVGTGFHPELTGRENIYLSGTILGMTRAEVARKFDEIVDFAGVEQFIDTPVKRYSSGMGLRLGFAVAAHLEPEILVVDEVLAVGDAEFQKKCLGKMEDVSTEGRTVIIVSHNMSSIRNICGRTLLLNNGSIIYDGDSDAAIIKYLANLSDHFGAIIQPPTPKLETPGHVMYILCLDNNGRPATEFQMGEVWKVTIVIKVSRFISHFIAALGIGSVERGSIMTIWSEPKEIEPGTYSVTFDINVPLAASTLQFDVGLSSHEQTFQSIQRIGYITITDIAVKEQPLRANIGVLYNATRPSIAEVNYEIAAMVNAL